MRVTGALLRLKCIEPLKRSKTLSEVRSPSAARISAIRPTLVELRAAWVHSMAAVAVPEKWLTLTPRPAPLAVTPGMFRLPERPVPCRPNQLAPAPSRSEERRVGKEGMARRKAVVQIARLS